MDSLPHDSVRTNTEASTKLAFGMKKKTPLFNHSLSFLIMRKKSPHCWRDEREFGLEVIKITLNLKSH